jgi:hypothetical protein
MLDVSLDTSLDCSLNFSYTQYMLTLSQASKDTKQFLKWGGIICFVIIFVYILLNIAIIVKQIITPPPPPKVTVAFGKLQPQNFPSNTVNQTLSYSINTLSGALPIATPTAKIYQIQYFPPDLLALNKFENRVVSSGYIKGYTQVSDKVFQWQSNNYSGISKIITANINTNNFNITSGFMTDTATLKGKYLPDQSKAIEIAKNMLTNMNFLYDDLDLDKTTTNLYAIQNNTLVPSTSLSNSQIIQVNFFQKDINDLPIFYEKPNSSNINILIGGGNVSDIVSASFVHQTISDIYSTYPIKTTAQAFEDLKQGKGYIAQYSGISSNIYINDMTLGYYMGSQLQDFLMPIFVFTGNDNFVAYVPAVTDEWINK